MAKYPILYSIPNFRAPYKKLLTRRALDKILWETMCTTVINLSYMY